MSYKYYVRTHACIFKSVCEKDTAEYILNHTRNLTAILFTDLQNPASNHIMERIRFNIENRDVQALERRLKEGYEYAEENKWRY